MLLSALQSVEFQRTFTIPAGTQSATLSLITSPTASYTMTLPPVNPTVGAFSATGTTYTAGAAGNASYAVEGQAFVPMSGGMSDCTQAEADHDGDHSHRGRQHRRANAGVHRMSVRKRSCARRQDTEFYLSFPYDSSLPGRVLVSALASALVSLLVSGLLSDLLSDLVSAAPSALEPWSLLFSPAELLRP